MKLKKIKKYQLSTLLPRKQGLHTINDYFLTYQILRRLDFERRKNATPDPIAILIEIRSEKFVEINNVSKTPSIKPI